MFEYWNNSKVSLLSRMAVSAASVSIKKKKSSEGPCVDKQQDILCVGLACSRKRFRKVPELLSPGMVPAMTVAGWICAAGASSDCCWLKSVPQVSAVTVAGWNLCWGCCQHLCRKCEQWLLLAEICAAGVWQWSNDPVAGSFIVVAYCGVGQKKFQSSGSDATTTRQSALPFQIVLMWQTQTSRLPARQQLETSDQFSTCETSFQKLSFERNWWQKQDRLPIGTFNAILGDQHAHFEKLSAQSIIAHPRILMISKQWSRNIWRLNCQKCAKPSFKIIKKVNLLS